MNKLSFIQLVRNPKDATSIDDAEIERMITEYPWFAMAHLLKLKILKLNKSAEFNDLLPLASLYAFDRRLLFKFIHENELDNRFSEWVQPAFGDTEVLAPLSDSELKEAQLHQTVDEQAMQQPLEENIERAKEGELIELSSQQESEAEANAEAIELNEVPKSEIIAADGLNMEALENPMINEPGLIVNSSEATVELESLSQSENDREHALIFENTTELQVFQDIDDEIANTEKEGTAADAPVENEQLMEASHLVVATTIPHPDETETHDFFSWLNKLHPSTKIESLDVMRMDDIPMITVDRPIVIESISAAEEDPDALIEKFIQESPSVKRKQESNYSAEEKVKASSELKDDLITETLVKIMVSQEKYEKAIESYKKLQLRYPNKKAYFAALIAKIEEKIKS